MQRLLVDTCALIWLATGDTRLSDSARNAMSKAELLCYSSISIWEIARKVKKGDTLQAIARKHHTTIAKLCELNHIGKNIRLRPGQILKYN